MTGVASVRWVVFSVGLFLLSAVLSVASSAAIISQSAPDVVYKAGDQFLLETSVSDLGPLGLGGFNLNLEYSAENFSLGTTTLTSFLGDPNVPLALPSITDTPGRRQISAVSLLPSGQLPATQGSGGILFQTQVTVIASGQSLQQLLISGQLADDSGAALAISTTPLYLTVYATAAPVFTLPWPALVLLIALLALYASSGSRRVNQ